MIAIDDSTTLGGAFFRATAAYGANSLLAVPANPARAYSPQGREISYTDAADAVRSLMARYRAAGYELAHRVGLFLESRPEHRLHKLALNALGVCCVPVNPDYRPRELPYDKAPGWLWFAESIPTTGTQKIQKHLVQCCTLSET